MARLASGRTWARDARVKDRFLITRSLEALLAVVGLDRAAPVETHRGAALARLAARFGRGRRRWLEAGRHGSAGIRTGSFPLATPPTGRAAPRDSKRLTEGRPVNADPWRLFPDWMRDQLPVPPGEATPKVRKLEFLAALQSRPPLWVGVRGRDEKTVWAELRDAELKPWIHRRIPTAAKLPPDTDLTAFESYRQGQLDRRTTSRRRQSRSSATPIPASDGGTSMPTTACTRSIWRP